MDRRSFPAGDLLQVEIEAQIQAFLDDGSLPDTAYGIAEDIGDVGQAVLDAPRLQDGPDAQRIAERPKIGLNRTDVAARRLARRLGLGNG